MGNGFEIAKTIAAFSGAGIGLVNLIWSLIKDFKVGCKVVIISHEIKSEYEGPLCQDRCRLMEGHLSWHRGGAFPDFER